VGRAQVAVDLVDDPGRVVLRDQPLVDEPRRVHSRTVGCVSIRSTMSGCVYAASSCSLWPKRR
jgi:hypothetical protein